MVKFVTIINDCRDDNAFGRQATRAAGLFGASVTTVGVEHNELEAAGNLIDMLDAANGSKGVILVNVAPRHGEAKKWPNGSPFGYFTAKQTLVVTSIDGETLSLVKKLKLTDEIKLLDIPAVTDSMVQAGILSDVQKQAIIHTQFRSFEFVPKVAFWISEGHDIPSTPYPITEVPDAPQAIWFVDNFGNCKTTLFPEDIDFTPGKKIRTTVGNMTCYARLKDVPNHEAGLVIGSSGIREHRFLELVIQGKSAAKELHVEVGQEII